MAHFHYLILTIVIDERLVLVLVEENLFGIPRKSYCGREGTYLPNNIFLISLSLFNASTGVRLFTSRPRISSRICVSTGSSS